VAPGEIYKTLDTPEGLDRAFAKLDALKPIWAHDSKDALEWVKNGRAVMATALNGDLQADKNYAPGVIWEYQLYELDVLVIPAGNPNKQRALDYIAYATGSAPLAAMANWVAFGPARHSALALVRTNPETGLAMRRSCPRRLKISPVPLPSTMAGGWHMATRWRRAGRSSSRDDHLCLPALPGSHPDSFRDRDLAFFMMRRRRAARSTASAVCRRKSSATSRRPTISTSR
jgi:hypothetical protein